MDFGHIVSRSLSIAWRYKWLWIFGMFASGGPSYFNLNIPTKGTRELGGYGMDGFELPWSPRDYLDITPELIGMFLLALFAIMLFFIVASLISKAAIIDSINRIERGGIAGFGRAFSAGIDFLLRFFGLMILNIIVVFLLIAFFVLILWGAFATHVAIGVVALLFCIPAMIFAIFVTATVFSLAERVIVVRNCSIGDALEEGYVLLKRNLGNCGVMFAIYIGLMIVAGLIGLMIWGILSLPMIGFGLLANMNPIAALFIGLAVGLPVTVIVGGYVGAFSTGLYTLFYFQLVEPVKTAMAPPPAPQAPMV